LTSTLNRVEVVVIWADSGRRTDALAIFHVKNQVFIARLWEALTGAFILVPVFA
jgi:hypothetical protein